MSFYEVVLEMCSGIHYEENIPERQERMRKVITFRSRDKKTPFQVTRIENHLYVLL